MMMRIKGGGDDDDGGVVSSPAGEEPYLLLVREDQPHLPHPLLRGLQHQHSLSHNKYCRIAISSIDIL